jgi:copper transporter 1
MSYDLVGAINKMDMSGSSSTTAASCKISMLWNWYTIDSCFIARSWHVSTKGQFAGSCIGCFLLVVSAQWLHRIAREYDAAIARRKVTMADNAEGPSKGDDSEGSTVSVRDDSKKSLMFLPANTGVSNLFQPIVYALSHEWYWNFRDNSSRGAAYPSIFEHLIRASIFTIQWGQSYIIMLLFMYYNGYIIISCILGALFGRIIFNYEPITCSTRGDSGENDKKCCM